MLLFDLSIHCYKAKKMTKAYFIFIVILFTGISCKNAKEYSPEGLIRLTEEEIITRARNLDWHAPNSVLYKDRNGDILPKDSLRKITDPQEYIIDIYVCLLYTSPSPRDATLSRMPSSA